MSGDMAAAQREVPVIREYWDTYPLGQQFVRAEDVVIGSAEFFAHIRPWMPPFKFPWILERIEREAPGLRGAHLLEVGCGMGFDSVEFLKRGVRVTATDLTPTAVELARSLFEIEGVQAEDVRMENVLELSVESDSLDAVWANGVLQHTGDPQLAVNEIHRVLKPGARAIISHFYRRPSWLHLISRVSKQNIEHKEEDSPVTDFLTETEILSLFHGFVVEQAVPEHYRALPIARRGFKAALYRSGFRPAYNLVPKPLAKRLAHKFSVTAVKKSVTV